MGSFAVFYLAGMYPLPATRQILLASPYFPQISFYNPLFNTTTTIKANGFVGNPADGVGGTVFVKVKFPRIFNLFHAFTDHAECDDRRSALEVQLLP